MSADNYHLVTVVTSGKNHRYIVTMEFMSEELSDNEKACRAVADHIVKGRGRIFDTEAAADSFILADGWTEYGEAWVYFPLGSHAEADQ